MLGPALCQLDWEDPSQEWTEPPDLSQGLRDRGLGEDPQGGTAAFLQLPSPLPKPASQELEKTVCFQFLLLVTPISLGSLAYQKEGERPGSTVFPLLTEKFN